jgi:hypothetical protein
MQEKMQRRMSLGEPVSPCGVPKGQQLFWWNRRAALIRIQRREVLGHINKDSAHQFPDVAQRMPFRHPLLKREVGKQSSLIPKSPAHRQIALVASRQRESYKTIRGDRFFSKLLERSAHLFSMPTNGLSLKPCGRPPPGRLIHGGHGAPRIFFVTLPGGGKPIFAAFWCALFALDGNARNQAVRRSTGSRAFASGKGIMSLINYSVNGAFGFVLWRRPQTRCRDFPHDARLLVSGVFGSEFEAFS